MSILFCSYFFCQFLFTLIKILAEKLSADRGDFVFGSNTRIGYYDQEYQGLDPNNTVLDELWNAYPRLPEVEIRNTLALFRFVGETVFKQVSVLSGGERARLTLAKLILSHMNLLILDEPTNDLDILTLNVLEEYLKSYTGSVIIVSHDRFFLDKIADHLFIFEGEGVVKDFVGSYSGYREYMKDKEKERRALEREKQQKEEKKRFVESENVPAKKRKLSYKEQRELEQIEKDLETLNAEKADLEEKLSGGNISGDELTRCSTRIGEVIALLDEKEMRWLELNDN